VTDEVAELHERDLGRLFELVNKDYFYSTNDMNKYAEMLGGIRDIELIGFDYTLPTRIRYICRNHSSFKYRFIISQKGEDGWKDVFDSDFIDVTENVGGLTEVFVEKSKTSVRILIDYSVIPDGAARIDGMLDANGRYKLKKACFREYNQRVKDIDSLTEDSVIATKNGTSYMVKTRYNDTQNLVVEFNKLGINEIIHPTKFYRQVGNKLNDDFENINEWFVIGTDWVSPYASATAIGAPSTAFMGTVGGNHGTSGASGFPTARNISAVLYVDGKTVSDGDVLFGEVAKLVVKNYVTACNKINTSTGEKADCFEELVIYTITRNNIEVSVCVTALEDMKFVNYVGLQITTNFFNNGFIYFNDGTEKHLLSEGALSSKPLPYDGDRFVCGDESDLFVVYTNRNVGLGNLEYKGDNPIFFANQWDKAYAHLVNTPITVEKGESIYYSGGYTFCEPLPCEGAEKAYVIKLNGKKFYCVDFLTSGVASLEMPIEAFGKEIEIVEKSESISCGTIINNSAFKIKASNYGNIKFCIKE